MSILASLPPVCVAKLRGVSLSSPKHRPDGRCVEALELQRQSNQFVVAGCDVGESEILDNTKIMPPANHVRREAFRRLRVDRRNVHADQPSAKLSQPLHGLRRQRAEASRPRHLVPPAHQFEKQARRSAVESGGDFLKATKRVFPARVNNPCGTNEIAET